MGPRPQPEKGTDVSSLTQDCQVIQGGDKSTEQKYVYYVLAHIVSALLSK